MPKTKQITITIEARTSGQLEGKIIKLLRISKNLSQSKMAQQLGVSRSTIQNWEKTGAPNEAVRIAIASVLDVDIGDLS